VLAVNASIQAARAMTYEVYFRSLFNEGRDLCFRCDAQGQVCLDDLGERARYNYLFARAMIGREFAWPLMRSTAEGERAPCAP